MVVREIELRSSDGDPVADVVGRQVLLRHQAPRGEQSLPATGQRYPYLEEAGEPDGSRRALPPLLPPVRREPAWGVFEGHEVGGGPRPAPGGGTGGRRGHLLPPP